LSKTSDLFNPPYRYTNAKRKVSTFKFTWLARNANLLAIGFETQLI